MNDATRADWDPGAYERFRDLRFRPALDLLERVPELPPGDLVDLGCGSGPVAAALAERFAGRRLIGVDASPAMLAKAAQTRHYDTLVEADIARWSPPSPPALIFSNAALQWLTDHRTLFARLLWALAAGGALAVQMPDQQQAPSHRLLREISADLAPELFDWTEWRSPVHAADVYRDWLAESARVETWHTLYEQDLPASEAGHPVRHFTQSTAARPVLNRLPPALVTPFCAAYDAALATAYPIRPDGSVGFPFRRFFLLAIRTEPGGADHRDRQNV